MISRSWLEHYIGFCYIDGEFVEHVRSGEVVHGIREASEFMDYGAFGIGLLELYDLCVCCSSPSPEVSYDEVIKKEFSL